MPEVKIGGVPFKEAIDHFRGKLNIPSDSWDNFRGDVNAKGFTVAGATKSDLLNDFNTSIEDMIANGKTITDFRKQFDSIVQKHGWSYKGKRGWRTRVIYDTNLRTAHMAGRWQQFQRVKENRPYLQYQTVGDSRVRPEHASWDNTILHIDDSWWGTHYPPNGWGCRCTVRSLSPRQIRREKLNVTDQAPPITPTERTNTVTGELYGDVPKGIDTGWDYNVGKAWLGPDVAFGEKIMSLPPWMRNAALKNAKDLAPQLGKAFSPWVTKMLKRKQPLGEIKTVGYLSPSIVDELARRSQAPTTAVITTTDKEIMHLLREAKDGKHLPADMIRSLPEFIHKPKAVLWDKRDPAVLYVFDVPGESRDGKVVIRVNYKTKARAPDGKRYMVKTNSLRTGGLVKLENLKDTEVYGIIDGKL